LNPDKPETKFTVIESTSVANKGQMIIQKTVNFSKPYVVETKWTNELDFIRKYFITDDVRMPPYTLSSKNDEYSIYSPKMDKFEFGK
jgi:hypothetical protein